MNLIGEYPVLEEKIEKWSEEEQNAARNLEYNRIEKIKAEFDSKGIVYNGQAEVFYFDETDILFKDNLHINLDPVSDLFIFNIQAYTNRQNKQDFKLLNPRKIEAELSGDMDQLLVKDIFKIRENEIVNLYNTPKVKYQIFPFQTKDSMKLYLCQMTNEVNHLKTLNGSIKQRFENVDQNLDFVILKDNRDNSSIGARLGLHSVGTLYDKRYKTGIDLKVARRGY